MRFRKLRIAWSVFWGLAAVLLIALWVRSYVWRDGCYIASRIHLSSCYGQITLDAALPPYSFEQDWSYWCDSAESTFRGFGKLEFARRNLLMFSWESFRPFRPCYFPHWSMVVPLAAFAIAPWIRSLSLRFSLRTLLIATTLVAVALGLVVWAAHR